jgi:hypothetical protein
LALERVLEHSKILEKEIKLEVPWKETEEKLKEDFENRKSFKD